MEIREKDNSAQDSDRKEEIKEVKSEKISEYDFFVSKDVQDSGKMLAKEEAKDSKKGALKPDQSASFFLSE